MPRGAALRAIHFPEDDAQRENARRHLVLSEFFGLQMLIAARRTRTVSRPGESHCGPGKLLERFHDSLPFGLTGAQHRCVREIRNDLAAARPMNRLLQGDVGAGKTLVALSAMLLAVEAGFQAVLMAPTQILAEQHYLVFQRWLEPLGLRLALRTGSRREETNGADDLFFGQKEPNDAGISGNHAIRETNDAICEPNDGVRELSHGVGDLSHGVGELSHGVGDLPPAGSELIPGARELIRRMNALRAWRAGRQRSA